MTRLLRANLCRMKRSRIFITCLGVTFALSAIYTYILVRISPALAGWDNTILAMTAAAVFAAAAFSTLFLGEDHSCGTIRNKVIIGCSRTQIYFANLLTVIIGGLLLTFAWELPPAVVGVFVFKDFALSAGSFAFGILVCVCAIAAACSIFTLASMLIVKRSSATAIVITLMAGAFAVTPTIKNKLAVPLTFEVSERNADGAAVERVFEEPNPSAVTGFPRAALEAVYNLLPFGQIKQAADETRDRAVLPLCSLGVFAVSTAAGIAVFRRKDLK